MSMSTATIESTPAAAAPGAAASTAMLTVKWDHFGQIRRFSISCTNDGDLYTALLEKIHALRPDFQGSLGWMDVEGDLIVMSSTDELKEAIALTKDGQLLKVFSVGDVEKEGDDDEVVVIDDDEEEQEENGETPGHPICQFMPRRLQRGRRCHSLGGHDRSRSRSRSGKRSSHSRSRSTSCGNSSDESACRKRNKHMAKGHKKEAKMFKKMMHHHFLPFAMHHHGLPFAMHHHGPSFAKSHCPKMAKKSAHHPLHSKLAQKFGHGGHAMNPMMMMMMRAMSHGHHPFFHGRRHDPRMPHGHHHPGMDSRHHAPPMFPMEDLPMDRREMGGCDRGMGRGGMGHRGMGCGGMDRGGMGHRGMGHRGMGMHGMGMRGFGVGCRGSHIPGF